MSADWAARLHSLLGLFAMIGLAWALSSHRAAFPRRLVAWGLALQIAFAVLLLRTPPGRAFFVSVNHVVVELLAYTESGVAFVFGPLAKGGFSIALHVLPVIVFSGSIIGVLYHLGVVQLLIRVFARLLAGTMRLSGAESLAATANIFLGMTEAPLLVRPYIASMTRSELFCVMTTGMATVAGSVLVAYSQMLGGGAFAGHLVAASLISAPAGVLIAKIMVPETESPATAGGGGALPAPETRNVIDAAAEGALAALRLAVYVGALLVVFVSLVAMLNAGVAAVGGAVGLPGLSLERTLGWIFAPLAWLMGIPWSEAPKVGELLGVKTVLNEFLAYQALADLGTEALTERTRVIAAYALCGFANLGSLAILLGGIGGMAPERRGELAELGPRAIAAGTLATLMTGCVAGAVL